MRIDIYIHGGLLELNDTRLLRIHQLLVKVAHQQEKIMGINEQLLEYSRRLDAASNEIAADLKKLRDEIKSGEPVTPETLAKLDANVARLEEMGVDPVEPIPAPEVPPPTSSPLAPVTRGSIANGTADPSGNSGKA